MWRWSCVLRKGLSAAVRYGNGNGGKPAFGSCVLLPKVMVSMLSSTAPPPPPPPASSSPSFASGDPISFAEAKKLMRLVNVEALKMKLGMEGKEVICYSELLDACESMGVARSLDEAAAFARVLDDAGIVLLFRNKVYLHPDKVVDLVRRAMPLALAPEDDPRRDELKRLQKKKEEIDRLAHKQVRRILWSGLGLTMAQVGLFFRLTFWEFSWDVMEPIAFFTTTSGIIVGYAYFLITSNDPTYQDMVKRLFLSRQRKLFKKHNFDIDRFLELQKNMQVTTRCLCLCQKSQDRTRGRFTWELIPLSSFFVFLSS